MLSITSVSHKIADLIQLLQTFPFILNENLLRLSISPHSLNFILPILALVVTAVSHPPVAFNLPPWWENLVTVSTPSQSISTGSFKFFTVPPHFLQAKSWATQTITFFISEHLAWVLLYHMVCITSIISLLYWLKFAEKYIKVAN